jgi:diphthamide synthase (EF-2-diphthine--ammonia ligase)
VWSSGKDYNYLLLQLAENVPNITCRMLTISRESQNAAFNAACEKVAQSLTQKERETFMAYYKDKSAEETQEAIKKLDDTDASTYTRRGMSSLAPVLGVLGMSNQCAS